MCLYWSSSVQVVTPYGLTDKIPVRRGVLQGDTLSPYLFIMVIDRVLRRAQLDESWGYRVQTRRRSLGDIYVTDLAFADDITLISSEFSYADLMLQAVAASGREAGLEINVEKTEVLVVGDLAAASPDWTLSMGSA